MSGLDVQQVRTTLSRDEILHRLVDLDDKDLSWVLHQLGDIRPELGLNFKEIVSGISVSSLMSVPSILHRAEQPPPVTPRTKHMYTLLGEMNLPKPKAPAVHLEESFRHVNETLKNGLFGKKMPAVVHPDVAAATLVQFSVAEFFCRQNEKYIEIQVSRSGNKSMESAVKYYTQPHSATPHLHYVPTSGTLVFPPGEGSARFFVALKKADRWEGLTEFRVYLEDYSAVNCTVARQVHFARVKIIGVTAFPSAKHQDLLEEGIMANILSIPWYSLLFEYLWMNFNNPDVRIGTLKRCLSDQTHNITYFFHLLLQVFLLDYVVTVDRPFKPIWGIQDRITCLICIASLDVFFVALVHWFDYRKYNWAVGGPSRKALMQGILMTFLNYDCTNKRLSQGDPLSMALTRDSVDLVHGGYSQSMKLVATFGELMMLTCFTMLSPLVFNRPVRVILFFPFFFFPVVQCIFICCRANKTTEALRIRQKREDDIVAYGHEALVNRGLILDYQLRREFVDCLEEHISNYNFANRVLNRVMLNNNYFMTWTTAILMAWWTIYGGLLVIEGSMTVGVFVTTFKVYDKAGGAFARAYAVVLQLQNVVPSLVRICAILNSATDLNIRLETQRANRQETIRKRKRLSAIHPTAALDHMNIYVKDVMFDFGEPHASSGLIDGLMRFEGTLEIEQGTMVCLVGREAEGKSTLMRLIGGAIMPTLMRGAVFIPSHLRVLHVMAEPLFFRGTMYYNLTVGVVMEDDAKPERLRKILNRLNLDKMTSEMLNSDEVWDWRSVLTMTQIHKLNLARALVANSHMLCVHKPTLVYDEETSQSVVKFLKEFVTERGVYQNIEQSQFNDRRPRTCIFTSSKQLAVDQADQIYWLKDGGVIEKVGRGSFFRESSIYGEVKRVIEND